MRLIECLYAFLLHLYPADQRALFAAEMSTVFASAGGEQRRRGTLALARFVCLEYLGLLGGAASEWMARLAEAVTCRRDAGQALDLTRMRSPDVSKQAYVAAIDEVLDARRLVDCHLQRMLSAISCQNFAEARFYSDEERKAREHWRSVQRKHRIPE